MFHLFIHCQGLCVAHIGDYIGCKYTFLFEIDGEKPYDSQGKPNETLLSHFIFKNKTSKNTKHKSEEKYYSLLHKLLFCITADKIFAKF